MPFKLFIIPFYTTYVVIYLSFIYYYMLYEYLVHDDNNNEYNT